MSNNLKYNVSIVCRHQTNMWEVWAEMKTTSGKTDVNSIKDIIQQMITHQGQKTGTKLPSVRELSAKLGVNRNTVYSAYKKLEASGIISIRRGSGVYITNVETKVADPKQLKVELSKYLTAARLSGLEKEDAQVMILNILHEVYQAQYQKILFVECNMYDSETIRRELMISLPIEVVPVTLSDVFERPEMLAGYQIVCTTYYHIKELERLDFKGKLIALHHSPSPKSVHLIATIPRENKLGIIASNARTLSLIKGFVMMFNHTQINECLSEDEEALQHTIDGSDIIITHYNAVSAIKKVKDKLSLIMVQFHIEPDSIKYLQEALMPL